MGLHVSCKDVCRRTGLLVCCYAPPLRWHGHHGGQLGEPAEGRRRRVESYWPGLFAKALGNQDMDKIISTPACGGGGCGGAAAGGAAAGGAAAGGAAAEEEEEEEEEEMAPAANLFGDEGDDY